MVRERVLTATRTPVRSAGRRTQHAGRVRYPAVRSATPVLPSAMRSGSVRA